MTVQARRYTSTPGFTDDFFRVRDFLRRINKPSVVTPGFLWARWEWAFCLPYQDRAALDRIGLWEADGTVVALATFELETGEAYLVVDPAHRELLPAMVEHALEHLRRDGTVRVLVTDGDRELQRLVLARGLRATDGRDPNSVLELTGLAPPALPAGYTLAGLDEADDVRRFDRLLHRGFDHPGEPPATTEDLRWRRRSMSSPGMVPRLNTVVLAPDGSYASYCGVWHAPGTAYALVEPVCTDPDHRRRGLAAAAVTEALRRCAARGATEGYVGAVLPLYRALGFAPVESATWWAVPQA